MADLWRTFPTQGCGTRGNCGQGSRKCPESATIQSEVGTGARAAERPHYYARGSARYSRVRVVRRGRVWCKPLH